MKTSDLASSSKNGAVGKFAAPVLGFLIGAACCFLFLRPMMLKYQSQLDQLKAAVENAKSFKPKGTSSAFKDREFAREQAKAIVAELQTEVKALKKDDASNDNLATQVNRLKEENKLLQEDIQELELRLYYQQQVNAQMSYILEGNAGTNIVEDVK